MAHAESGPPDDKTLANRSISLAITKASGRLGKAPAVCQTSYVHAAMLAAYGCAIDDRGVPPQGGERRGREPGLQVEGAALLALFRARRERPQAPPAA